MGYTHYWTFRKPKGTKAADLEALYQKAIAGCNKVIQAYQLRAADWERLSGYSAHTKGIYGGIKINGKGDLSHEDFILREHFSQNFESKYSGQISLGSDFCKTARKPYDIVVTACLSVLKYYLGDAIEVSSDGDTADWAEGTLLAALTIRRAIKNPIPKPEPVKAVAEVFPIRRKF